MGGFRGGSILLGCPWPRMKGRASGHPQPEACGPRVGLDRGGHVRDSSALGARTQHCLLGVMVGPAPLAKALLLVLDQAFLFESGMAAAGAPEAGQGAHVTEAPTPRGHGRCHLRDRGGLRGCRLGLPPQTLRTGQWGGRKVGQGHQKSE